MLDKKCLIKKIDDNAICLINAISLKYVALILRQLGYGLRTSNLSPTPDHLDYRVSIHKHLWQGFPTIALGIRSAPRKNKILSEKLGYYSKFETSFCINIDSKSSNYPSI